MGEPARYRRRADPQANPGTDSGRGSALRMRAPALASVYFEAWTSADIYDRGRLGAGDVIVGPAILEEFGSTIPVHPGFTASVDPYGNVLLSREAQ